MADETTTTAAPETLAPAPQPAAAPKRTVINPYIWGTGRRKKAVARVRIKSGSGAILVNDRKLEEYFPSDRDRGSAQSPLVTANVVGKYDVWVNVNGGGSTGQADAIQLGLARALIKIMPDVMPSMREQGHLTRDARMKERKKYGQKGARKRFQFSKR